VKLVSGRPADRDAPGQWRARTSTADRGQAHTLEGVVASLVLLSAVVFALEMTAVTPLSASTSSQHIENQQEATARGVLGSGAETGALKRTLLFWNTTSGQFFNVSERGYYTSPPPTDFGAMLNRSFDRNGVAYNVYLRYQNEDGPRSTRILVYQGRPSDNAVSASWSVALFQDDKLLDHENQPTDVNVSDAPSYFAGNTTDSSVHNVVHVEVVVWRI
jgi:hypothetical protein